MFIQAGKLVHIIKKVIGRRFILAGSQEGVNIGTISGGIVNFGGAGTISPITVTKTNSGSGSGNQGADSKEISGIDSLNQKFISDLLELIRRSLE